MQEIIFAAPKAGPKSRPAAGREEAAGVSPIDRRSPERGRESDFGAVVDAEERAAARKPSGDEAKAEPGEGTEDVSIAGEDAAPSDAPVFGAETVPDAAPETPAPVPADSEAKPVGPEIPMVGEAVGLTGTAEAMATEDIIDPVARLTAPLPGATGPVDTVEPVGPPASVGPAVQTVSAAAPVAGGSAGPPVSYAAPPATGDLVASPTPDAEAAPTTRDASDAPAGAPQSGDVRATIPAPQQAAPQPILAGGFALGAAIAEGVDWRLTPQLHAPVPTAATAQLQPPAITGQIAVAIAQSANSRIEVRLDPPELGRVQIQLNPTERGVHVIVMSERPETGDFLRRHGETLARDLTDAGYGDVTMEFTAGGSDTPRERDGAQAAAPRIPAAPEKQPMDAEPAPEKPRAVASGTLDIRL